MPAGERVLFYLYVSELDGFDPVVSLVSWNGKVLRSFRPRPGGL